MQHFDSDYGAEVVKRIRRIPEDAAPRWGEMGRDDMVAHFVWILRHTMGLSTQVPDCSTWFLRNITKALVLHGLMSFPKNMRLPATLTGQGIVLQEAGDVETLQALMEEYLQLVQADELLPASHPFFGPLDVDGWDRLHVRHFEYHLNQFNA